MKRVVLERGKMYENSTGEAVVLILAVVNEKAKHPEYIVMSMRSPLYNKGSVNKWNPDSGIVADYWHEVSDV